MVKITTNVSKKTGRVYVSLHSPSMTDWRGISPSMLRAVIRDFSELEKYARMTDEQIEQIAYAQEKELSQFSDTLIGKILHDSTTANASTAKKIDNAPAKADTTADSITQHIPTFVEWMCNEYMCDKEQARYWENDAGYQAEYKNYVQSLTPQRPVKRAASTGTPDNQRHVKRDVTSNPKRESEKRMTMEQVRSKASGITFSVIVNGKQVELSALNKSDAVNVLNSKAFELTSKTTGRTTRVMENADTIRMRGSSPSHTFDTLVKGGYVEIR